MILFTNGCSWTYGGGLGLDLPEDNEKRLKSVWPYFLAQKLKIDKVVNLAEGGGSNQRIFRTTLDWLHNTYDKKEEAIAVIQLTDPLRYEFYVTDKIDDFSNDPDKWALVKNDCLLNGPDDKEAYNDSQIRFKNYTLIEGMYSLIRDCSALSFQFNQFKIKFYFWTYEIYPDVTSYKLLKTQDFNFLNFNNEWEYQRVSASDFHPSFAGHIQLAQLIYDEIKP